jgi:hypothetical protein
MTLNNVLFVLAGWTSVSVVVGLGLGQLLRYCSEADAGMPIAMPQEAVLRKSA